MNQQSSELVKFDKLKTDITLFVKPTLAIKVGSVEESHQALAAVREVKSYDKRIEELRDSLVRPLNEQVKAINAYAKSIAEPLKTSESHLKSELIAWEKVQEQERRKKALEAEAERKRKEAEAVAKAKAEQEEIDMLKMFEESPDLARQEVVAQVNAERVQAEIEKEHKQTVAEIEATKIAGVSKVWTFAIEDASKVPREFLIVDEKLIRQAVKAGSREIPGVRIFQDTRMAVR